MGKCTINPFPRHVQSKQESWTWSCMWLESAKEIMCLLKPNQYFMTLFPLVAWGRRMCEFWIHAIDESCSSPCCAVWSWAKAMVPCRVCVVSIWGLHQHFNELQFEGSKWWHWLSMCRNSPMGQRATTAHGHPCQLCCPSASRQEQHGGQGCQYPNNHLITKENPPFSATYAFSTNGN